MELIAAILVAGPLGYVVQTRTRVRGIASYLVLWTVLGARLRERRRRVVSP